VISTWIALGALALSFVGFIVQQIRAQKSASSQRVKDLEEESERNSRRIDGLENDLRASRARVNELEDENLRLLRKLFTNGVK
jgi:TolA-binding protein